MGERTREEQFDQLVRSAEAEPHRSGDKLHFNVVSNGRQKYAGHDATEAKRVYLEHAGAMRVVVDAEWRRPPKFFSTGDDPEYGVAVKAQRGELELRADAITLLNLSVEGAEDLKRLLTRAIRYARLA